MCEEFKLNASKLIDAPWACLVDLSDWQLAGRDIWEPIVALNHWCSEHNQALEAVVCEMAVQKFMIERAHGALPETQIAFFDNMTKAKQWIRSKGYDFEFTSPQATQHQSSLVEAR